MAGHRPYDEIKTKMPDTPETWARRDAAIERLAAEADANEAGLAEAPARAFTHATLGEARGRLERGKELYRDYRANGVSSPPAWVAATPCPRKWR